MMHIRPDLHVLLRAFGGKAKYMYNSPYAVAQFVKLVHGVRADTPRTLPTSGSARGPGGR